MITDSLFKIKIDDNLFVSFFFFIYLHKIMRKKVKLKLIKMNNYYCLLTVKFLFLSLYLFISLFFFFYGLKLRIKHLKKNQT